MSIGRALDDVARALGEPMPRRGAVRLMVTSLAALAFPGASPHTAGAAARPGRRGGTAVDTCGDGSQCQGAGEKCCPSPNLRGAYNCYRPSEGESCCGGNAVCADPKKQPHRSRCVVIERAGYCVPDCKLTNGRDWQDCGLTCCSPQQECRAGKCVARCPDGRPRCGSTCCSARQRCAFNPSGRGCCPRDRIVSRKIKGQTTRFCCPAGTVSISGDVCCPPGNRDCCEELAPLDPGGGDDPLTPLDPYTGRTFCVNGKPKKL